MQIGIVITLTMSSQTMKLRQLNGSQPLFILLFTPVLLLHVQIVPVGKDQYNKNKEVIKHDALFLSLRCLF